VSVADRVRLIEALVAAGVRHIEAAAFVSPKVVPAMAGAAEVMAAVPRSDGVRYAALVPNRRGAEMALAAKVDDLTVTISISETYNQRNVRMTTTESEAAIGDVTGLAGSVPVDAVISCAFGSPYEGDVEPTDVAALAARLRDSGCSAITCADTTGMATPRRISDLVGALGPDIGLHLHDTRGTALANILVAVELGITTVDAALGGLGGCPYAPGASGNVATEDVIYMLEGMGVHTGVDLDKLIDCSRLASSLVGHEMPSKYYRAAMGARQRASSRAGASG
jgi:hydroxymethylglutaryl-CoA lyase